MSDLKYKCYVLLKFCQEQISLTRAERLCGQDIPRKKGHVLLSLSVKRTSTAQPGYSYLLLLLRIALRKGARNEGLNK